METDETQQFPEKPRRIRPASRWIPIAAVAGALALVAALALFVRADRNGNDAAVTAGSGSTSTSSSTGQPSGAAGSTAASSSGPASESSTATGASGSGSAVGGDAATPSTGGDTVTSSDPGIRLSWEVDDPAPDPGQLVTFTVRVHDRPPGSNIGLLLNTTQGIQEDGPIVTCGADAFDEQPHHFSWAFRVGGHHDLDLFVSTCDGVVVARTTVGIDVTPGTGPANGPRQPVLDRLEQQPGSNVQLVVQATDRDGIANEFSIDWGDGSPPETVTLAGAECTYDENDDYSSGTYAVEPTHTYALPGTYHVHVIATSYGCGRADPQTAEGATDVVAG